MNSTPSAGIGPDSVLEITRPPIAITQLVMFCGSMGIFDPIHFSADIAMREGFPGIVVNGSLRVAFLAQLATSLLGPGDQLTRLTCRHRSMILIGDSITTRARIESISGRAAGRQEMKLKLWNETARNGLADEGTATIELASNHTDDEKQDVG
jgi:acyl dehydratase